MAVCYSERCLNMKETETAFKVFFETFAKCLENSRKTHVIFIKHPDFAIPLSTANGRN